ncbi:MAG: hypothetical protein FJZ58_04310 [Chlamydiae bacterium]|nr:hypothetical protein [Chlamydiota bacterium]
MTPFIECHLLEAPLSSVAEKTEALFIHLDLTRHKKARKVTFPGKDPQVILELPCCYFAHDIRMYWDRYLAPIRCYQQED